MSGREFRLNNAIYRVTCQKRKDIVDCQSQTGFSGFWGKTCRVRCEDNVG